MPASAKRSKTSASSSTDSTPPEVVGVVGLSTEKGVFLVAATATGSATLADFRLAVREPFERAIHIGASKCRQASQVVTESSASQPKDFYLSFISVPSTKMVQGRLLYRAKASNRHEVFFEAVTQTYTSLESEKLIKLLGSLSDGFAELLSPVLGKDHALVRSIQQIQARKQEFTKWTATQKEVTRLLQEGKAQQALELLSPLVFTEKPNPQAEKLMAELLNRAARSGQSESSSEERFEPLETLKSESLMLLWYLSRTLQVSVTSEG